VLLVRSVTRVDEALLDGSMVQFVGTATSGFDHIDREYLAKCHIGFSHAPGSNANSVVEYVLAAIAAIDDKLEQLLCGGTVGIIGYGFVGKAVAARFGALGIQYLVYDPWLDQNTVPDAAGLDAVLDCDVVTLHAALTNMQPWPSHHLLGARELQRLRAGTLLINASRGPVVDNEALLAHLLRNPNRSTVLDVWEGEPVVQAALLAEVSLGTAHIAGYSLDGKLLATRMLSEALVSYLGLAPLSQTSAVEAAAAIDVGDAVSTAQLLRRLVQARYDIFKDDTLLRAAVASEQGKPAGGAGFDLLRKSYRDRRELAGSAVQGLHLAEHLQLARAFGCIPALMDTPL
jgi:erythronate-4-phosphate dehydrogenase